jgi:Signal peptide binding domain
MQAFLFFIFRASKPKVSLSQLVECYKHSQLLHVHAQVDCFAYRAQIALTAQYAVRMIMNCCRGIAMTCMLLVYAQSIRYMTHTAPMQLVCVQLMNMLPMFNNMGLGSAGADKETQTKFRKYNTVMDSMTDRELDETNVNKLFDAAKIRRIAHGSGSSMVRCCCACCCMSGAQSW